MHASYQIGLQAGQLRSIQPGLRFHATAAYVVNPGGQTLQFPELGVTVDPYTQGVVVPLPAVNNPVVLIQARPGLTDSGTGQPATVTFTDGPMPPSPGAAIPQPALGFNYAVISGSLTPGAATFTSAIATPAAGRYWFNEWQVGATWQTAGVDVSAVIQGFSGGIWRNLAFRYLGTTDAYTPQGNLALPGGRFMVIDDVGSGLGQLRTTYTCHRGTFATDVVGHFSAVGFTPALS